ncbi:MAG: hypothetical protein CVU55_00175 [Deltaproteobacteria bacterium HGW-Deltaproteobacteria-13]|jgi:hypothetical protein|nr:MAG: hypothetical protein CVU55_00175 [Deltaproteobacteria bacterium HGW-Deltaproteobacteria-13]
MAWHLNLRHGFYSCKVPKEPTQYSNKFGVKDHDRKIALGDINFDLVDLEKNNLIRIEGNTYYRIIIWYDEPRFYVSKSKDNGPKYYLDLSYPKKSEIKTV